MEKLRMAEFIDALRRYEFKPVEEECGGEVRPVQVTSFQDGGYKATKQSHRLSLHKEFAFYENIFVVKEDGYHDNKIVVSSCCPTCDGDLVIEGSETVGSGCAHDWTERCPHCGGFDGYVEICGTPGLFTDSEVWLVVLFHGKESLAEILERSSHYVSS